MPEPIFLRVGEGQSVIELPQLVGALGDFLGLLREYDASVGEKKSGTINWRVTTLEKNPAPLVGVTAFQRNAYVDISDRVEQELIDSVTTLTDRGERSKLLSDASLRRVQRLAQMSPKLGPSRIFTKIKRVPVQTLVTTVTLRSVEELTRVRSSSFGSITGSLGAISVHKGREFRVWDEQIERPVRCFFEAADESKVKDLLGRRVTVTGQVRADQFGRPISLKVEDFDLIVARQELPTIEEMRGILPNFTGGLSLRDYFKEFE